MTIASEITRINGNIEAAYTAASSKGATLPETQNSANLATCIDSIVQKDVDHGGTNLVQVIDYDGTIIKQDHLNRGVVFELPDPPTHTGLTFQRWVSNRQITDNTITVGKADVLIGPIYTTTSGMHEFDITLTPQTGLNVDFYMDGTKYWGDGTNDTETSHTYPEYGDYTIKCNGTTITASASNHQSVFGSDWLQGEKNYTCTAIRLNSNLSYNNRFSGLNNLQTINNPYSNYTLIYSAIKTLIFSGYNLTIYNFEGSSSLVNVVIPYGMTIIGNSVNMLNCSCLKKLIFPSSITRFTLSTGTVLSNNSILLYDFSDFNNILPMDSIHPFETINPIAKIRVPFDLYNDWTSTTNWAYYANYIDGGNKATLNFSVTPSGSDVYVRGSKITNDTVNLWGISADYMCYNETINTLTSNIVTGITEGTVMPTVNVNLNATSHKIIISTEVTGLTVTFTINGIEFTAVEENQGDYVINIIESGVEVHYFINGGSGYLDAEGTVTSSTSDVTVNVQMVKVTIATFNRPNLTANGDLGGSSFAVTANRNTANAYKAVDDNSSNTYYNGETNDNLHEYTIYNPNPINITNIAMQFTGNNYLAKNVTIQASSDGSLWVNLTSSYPSSPSTTSNLEVTTDKYYNYYKINMYKNASMSLYGIRLRDMVFTATEKTLTPV